MHFKVKGTASTLLNTALDPYDGPWDFAQAAHLLRRCTFGPNLQQIQTAVEQGLDATVETLFTMPAAPIPPVNFDVFDDPNVPVGGTWITASYTSGYQHWFYRNRSLRAWIMEQLINERTCILEKMTLFWHNHFAVSEIIDPKYTFRYISTLRNYAWGNFKDLVKAMCIDPAMLRFLNGNQNVQSAPNENFARELLELYTLGKGELAGPGDYTSYTEEDVLEIARILTGWRDHGHLSTSVEEIGIHFIPIHHDPNSKRLSHRFNNIEIPNMGAEEYAHLIDIIFLKKEAARFICRKLYRWFVGYKIEEEIEQEVIHPMAELLFEHNFNIQIALETLLKSQHFFSIFNKGHMIKSPLDFVLSPLKQFGIPIGNSLENWQDVLYFLYFRAANMGQEYLFPPDVGGWSAYYQAPLYYRRWINGSTLSARFEYINVLTKNGYTIADYSIKINPLPILEYIENPYNPDDLIQQLARLIYPMPLTEEQLSELKEVLLPGLPDFEWTVEYEAYLTSPSDTELSNAITNKLKHLLNAMFGLEEYHLM